MSGTPTTLPERKWQMIRVSKGVYLLPSNDRQTLWRISSYTDDLPDPEERRSGTFWETARYRIPLPKIAPHLIGGADSDFIWGENWESFSFGHRTRRAAIDDILSVKSA